jgi:hypothetical protein
LWCSKSLARLALVLCVTATACSNSADEALGREVTLRGSVQKGPFVIGSSVSVSLLNSDLAPTGQVFNTQTSNDRGEFDVAFPASGPVSLQGEGYYFNEVTGELSTAALTLRAFYAPDQSEGQRVFINMVTHLTAERIKTLVGKGTGFVAAVNQAESALLRELHITSDSYQPSVTGVSMDVTGGDTRDNAYLLGVSSVLIQVAIQRAGSLDAALQEILNTYTIDLADDGALEQNRKDDVASALGRLHVDAVHGNLARRLAELGSTDAVPDMWSVIDVCADGNAGGDSSCYASGGLGEACGRAGACDDGLACLPAQLRGQCPAPLNLDQCCQAYGGQDERCGPNDSCDNGLTCAPRPFEGLASLCQLVGTLNQRCRSVPPRSCDQGLRCASVGPERGKCTPIGGLGEPCIGDSAIENTTCNGDLVCHVGAACAGYDLTECCLPPSGSGEPCSGNGCAADLVCLESATCSGGSNSWCCVPAGGDKQPCLADQTCSLGFSCVSNPPACSPLTSPCCLPSQ